MCEFHDRIDECKKGEFCVACGESDPRVLEFDHRAWDGKTFMIGKRRKRSDEAFFFEVAKTQFLCANCHMDKSSAERQERWPRGKSERSKATANALNYNNEQKRRAGRCVDCHLHVPLDADDCFQLTKFHWDHCAMEEKSFEIGAAASRGWSTDRIAPEISKCELRCANCHKRRTALQLNYRKYTTAATARTGVRVPWASVVHTNPKNQGKLALLIADGLIERHGAEVRIDFADRMVTARRYTTEQGECLRRVDIAARLLARWNTVQEHVSKEINVQAW
jgi:hypothetical protein